MKILTAANITELLGALPPWWIGYTGRCPKCSCTFLLEKGDNIEMDGIDHVEVRCPGFYADGERCNRLVTINSAQMVPEEYGQVINDRIREML